MRQLILIIISVFIFVACSRHTSLSKVDASVTIPTVEVTPWPNRSDAQLQTRRPKPIKADAPKAIITKPDARVQHCAQNSADKQSFMTCLESMKQVTESIVDAGRKLKAARPPFSCPVLTVTDWYFAPTGNDQNTCADSGHPCLTFEEVESRWGCGGGPNKNPEFPNSVLFHVHGDMPATSPLRIFPFMKQNLSGAGQFGIVCDTTNVGSGTMSGVVAKNRHTGPPDQALNANLGGSAPSFVSLQIKNTTRNSLAWVDSMVPLSDGGPSAISLLTQPMDLSTGGEADNTANTDAFTIIRPGQLYISEMKGQCETAECYGGYPNFGAQPQVTNCWLPKITGITESPDLEQITFIDSRIDSTIRTNNIHLINSIITTSPEDFISSTLSAGSMSAASAANTIGNLFSGGYDEFGCWIFNDAILHGTVIVNEMTQVSITEAYCDNGSSSSPATWFINGSVFPVRTDTPDVYGNCIISTSQNGYYSFQSASAAAVFGLGVSLQAQAQAAGGAVAPDYSHNPNSFFTRALSPLSLFVSVEDGGFGGRALSDNLVGGFYNWQPELFSLAPPPLVWPPANGGTGLDGGCPAGSIVEGDDAGTFRCSPICGPNDVVVTDSTGTTHICSSPSPHQDAGALLTWSPGGGTPASLSGLTLWLKQDAGVHLSGSNVTQWDDQSGNGNNVANAANQPTFNATGGPGGSGRLTFGAGEWLQSATTILASGHDRTIWAVSSPTTSDPASLITFRTATPYATFQTASNGAPMHLYSDGVSVNDTTSFLPSSAPHLFEWTYTLGSPITWAVDGTFQSVSAGNVASDTGAAGFQIGRNSNAQYWSGDIEEIVVVDHVASSIENGLVAGYVFSKYGIATGVSSFGWSPETVGAPHSVVVAETEPTLGFITPGASGTCLCSTGTSTDETFQSIVNSVVAGTGIGVSSATGNVTISNTGVTSLVAGSGISVSGATGAVTISNTGAVVPFFRVNSAGSPYVLSTSQLNVLANMTGATIQLTLPTAPADGTTFTLTRGGGGTGTVTIVGGGSDTIQDMVTHSTFSSSIGVQANGFDFHSNRWLYAATEAQWRGLPFSIVDVSGAQSFIENPGSNHSFALFGRTGASTGSFGSFGPCGTDKIPLGAGASADPTCSTWTIAAPGTSGHVLTSDGTNWTSAALPAIPTIASSANHGTSQSLSQGTYTTLATVTMTISGTVVDCTSSVEWDPVGQTGTATMQYGISQDSTTTPSATRSLAQNASFALGGALVESYTGVSAGSHTYRLLAETTTTCPGCTTDTARGDLLCVQH